ncbi:MAG: hypothetical protein HFE82_02205 [Erysipelotrichaceae bacterium]|nr:hypothetical protein [Erysipelotrichaceae bacterium]
MKKLLLYVCVLCAALILNGCSSHVCDRCGKKFTGSAYYISKEPGSTICEDCARDYYDPFPYGNFKK